MKRTQRLGTLAWRTLLTLCGAFLAASAMAQEPGFPAKPLKFIVGFAPGNGNDTIARELAQLMSQDLGQTIIVENRTGAGGTIGTEEVAKAPPDGYVLGFGTSSQLVMNAGYYTRLRYDPSRDLASIGLVSRTSLVLAASADAPPTLSALVARAKARPGEVIYGSAGNGSITHIVAEDFQRKAGIRLTHAPYKGNGPALSDLAGGHINLLFASLLVVQPLVQQGRVHVLAISGDKRSPRAPDVPTFREAGVPDYEAYTWNSLVVPKRTPAPVVARLNEALNKALMRPEMKERLAEGASESLGPSTPAEADAFVQRESAKWLPFVRSLKLVPE